MAKGWTNSSSGEGTLINGIIEQYYATTDDISANSFVSFTNELNKESDIYSLSASTSSFFDAIEVSANKVLMASKITYSSSLGTVRLTVLEIGTDKTITVTSDKVVIQGAETYLRNVKLCKLQNDLALVVFSTSDSRFYIQAAMIDTSGTNPSVWGKVDVGVNSDGTTIGYILNLIKINNNSFIIGYDNVTQETINFYTYNVENKAVTYQGKTDITHSYGAYCKTYLISDEENVNRLCAISVNPTNSNIKISKLSLNNLQINIDYSKEFSLGDSNDIRNVHTIFSPLGFLTGNTLELFPILTTTLNDTYTGSPNYSIFYKSFELNDSTNNIVAKNSLRLVDNVYANTNSYSAESYAGGAYKNEKGEVILLYLDIIRIFVGSASSTSGTVFCASRYKIDKGVIYSLSNKIYTDFLSSRTSATSSTDRINMPVNGVIIWSTIVPFACIYMGIAGYAGSNTFSYFLTDSDLIKIQNYSPSFELAGASQSKITTTTKGKVQIAGRRLE